MGLGLWSETMPEAMLNVECCNRLCRLPEQELSALPMLNYI